MHRIQKIAPGVTEGESSQMIEEEFYKQTGVSIDSFDPSIFAALRRAINATGYFPFAAKYSIFGKEYRNWYCSNQIW